MHYSGFILPVIAGLTLYKINADLSQKPSLNLQYLVTFGVVFGTPCISLGVLLSPTLEIVSVLLFGIVQIALATLTIFFALSSVTAKITKTLFWISGMSLIISALFSFLYGLGEYFEGVIVSIPTMSMVHGLVNSFGFSLCGLLAWLIHINEKISM